MCSVERLFSEKVLQSAYFLEFYEAKIQNPF